MTTKMNHRNSVLELPLKNRPKILFIEKSKVFKAIFVFVRNLNKLDMPKIKLLFFVSQLRFDKSLKFLLI